MNVLRIFRTYNKHNGKKTIIKSILEEQIIINIDKKSGLKKKKPLDQNAINKSGMRNKISYILGA